MLITMYVYSNLHTINLTNNQSHDILYTERNERGLHSMDLYVVVCSYYFTGFFGTYSTIKRARIAFEDAIANDENIVAYEDIDGYAYQFTTKNGETFGAEICCDTLDAEFEEGICQED